MRIVLIIHHNLTKDAGAAGVVLALAEEFIASGHPTVIISHDTVPWLSGRLRSLVFPIFCAWKLLWQQRDVDVVDASSGTAWLYYILARSGKRPLFVTHSHGLPHVIHDQLLSDQAMKEVKISWKYRFYNGSLMLWQDAESFRRADLALFLNQADLRYASARLGVSRSKSYTVPNGLSNAYLEAARLALRPVAYLRRRVVQ